MSGPFGNYESQSAGGVLNALCAFGVPMHIVDSVIFDSENNSYGSLTYRGKPFADYKYFEGIQQPLFRFRDEYSKVFAQQTFVVNDDKTLRPRFKLMLSKNDTASLILSGRAACREAHDFISDLVLCQAMGDVRHKLRTSAGALFQNDISWPDNSYIFIEFLRPPGAQAFVDYVNENCKVTLKG